MLEEITSYYQPFLAYYLRNTQKLRLSLRNYACSNPYMETHKVTDGSKTNGRIGVV